MPRPESSRRVYHPWKDPVLRMRWMWRWVESSLPDRYFPAPALSAPLRSPLCLIAHPFLLRRGRCSCHLKPRPHRLTDQHHHLLLLPSTIPSAGRAHMIAGRHTNNKICMSFTICIEERQEQLNYCGVKWEQVTPETQPSSFTLAPPAHPRLGFLWRGEKIMAIARNKLK